MFSPNVSVSPQSPQRTQRKTCLLPPCRGRDADRCRHRQVRYFRPAYQADRGFQEHRFLGAGTRLSRACPKEELVGADSALSATSAVRNLGSVHRSALKPLSVPHRLQANHFTAENAETAERATNWKWTWEARNRSMWSCPPAVTLKPFDMEGFLCVLGALCGSTATFGFKCSPP